MARPSRVEFADAVYHLTSRLQITFALAGLLVPGALAGLLLLAAAVTDPAGPLARLGAAALLTVYVGICPFLQTDGARLTELLTSVDRQRFRVRTFIARRPLRGLLSAGRADSGRLTAVAVLWFAWFAVALRLVVRVLMVDLLALQAAVLGADDPALAVVGGLFFAGLVVLVLVMLGTMAAISVALLVQILTPEGVRAPSRKAGDAADPDEVRTLTLLALAARA